MDYSRKSQSIKERKNGELYIYSEIILEALYNSEVKNGGNGARLYFLAKDWDKSKRGSILEDEFRSYIVNELKIADWNYRRWLNSAIEIGLIKRALTPKGKKLLLTGYRKACGLLEIERLQSMTSIKIKDLIGKNWKSEIFACFIATVQGRPISRLTIEKLSGVKVKTQYNLEKRTNKIKNIRNYAKDTTLDKSDLQGFREYKKNHAFLNAEQITWRIADTKEADSSIKLKGKTTTRKHINSFIRSSILEVGKIFNRLYCNDYEELKKTQRKRDTYCKDYLYLKAEQPGYYYALNF